MPDRVGPLGQDANEQVLMNQQCAKMNLTFATSDLDLEEPEARVTIVEPAVNLSVGYSTAVLTLTIDKNC